MKSLRSQRNTANTVKIKVLSFLLFPSMINPLSDVIVSVRPIVEGRPQRRFRSRTGLIEPCLQKEFEVEECQTSFNLTAIGFMEDAKKNAHRLQMQAKRLNERIKKLRQTCDEFQDRFKQGRLMYRTRSTLQVTCPECKL